MCTGFIAHESAVASLVSANVVELLCPHLAFSKSFCQCSGDVFACCEQVIQLFCDAISLYSRPSIHCVVICRSEKERAHNINKTKGHKQLQTKVWELISPQSICLKFGCFRVLDKVEITQNIEGLDISSPTPLKSLPLRKYVLYDLKAQSLPPHDEKLVL